MVYITIVYLHEGLILMGFHVGKYTIHGSVMGMKPGGSKMLKPASQRPFQSLVKSLKLESF